MAKIGIKLKQGMGIEEKKNGTEPITKTPVLSQSLNSLCFNLLRHFPFSRSACSFPCIYKLVTSTFYLSGLISDETEIKRAMSHCLLWSSFV